MHTLDKGTIVWRAIAVVALLLLSERTWALDNVTLITDFGYNGRHAYFFVAIEKGYYRDADLDVKVSAARDRSMPSGRSALIMQSWVLPTPVRSS